MLLLADIPPEPYVPPYSPPASGGKTMWDTASTLIEAFAQHHWSLLFTFFLIAGGFILFGFALWLVRGVVHQVGTAAVDLMEAKSAESAAFRQNAQNENDFRQVAVDMLKDMQTTMDMQSKWSHESLKILGRKALRVILFIAEHDERDTRSIKSDIKDIEEYLDGLGK